MILFFFLIFSSTFKLSSQLQQQHHMNFSSQVISTYILTIIRIYTHNSSSLLNNANLTQLVNFPTHQTGHTLDLVITTKDSTLSPTITHSLVSLSDHFPIFTSLVISPPSPPSLTEHFFRCVKSINLNNFIHDIRTSRRITHPPTNLSDLDDCYNSTLSNILNKHAPLTSKLLRPKPSNTWFTPALQKLKSARRHLEKIWSWSHSTFDLKLLRSATNHYHTSIIKAKKLYSSIIKSVKSEKNAATQSTYYYTELSNLHFLHLFL